MLRIPESTVLRYGAAVVGAVIATALRFALGPLVGDRYPFTIYFALVAFAAWYGGFGPSILALCLGGFAGTVLFLPSGGLDIGGVEVRVGTLVFALVGLTIALMGGAMRSARQKAEESAREALHHLHAEHELRERLDITLQSIGDAVLATDAGGRVVSMNRVAEDLTGWTSAEALGRPLEEVFRIVDEETGEPVESPVANALRTGGIVGLTNSTALISRNGTIRPIDDSAAPIRDEEGAIQGAVLVFRDDTEQRVAARALRESEARKAAILEAAIDCIITMDQEGKVVEFNPAAEETFGYCRADALGRELCDLIVPPSLREAHRRGLAHYRATGEAPILGKRIEVAAMRADGTEFPVELAVTRIATTGSALFTAYLRDITERKQAEAARAERSRLAEFGREIGLVITESATHGEMLDRCVEATVRHLDGAFARIWTADEAGTLLELRASAGIYTHLDGAHARIPVGRFKIGTIARERRPHLTNAVLGDPHVPNQDWVKREGMVAFAGFPLVVGERLVGVWAMFARHALSDEVFEAMAAVANGIAVGLDRKRAMEAVVRSEGWLATTLASIGDAVIATDGHGQVRFMNPIAEQLTGWTQGEASGRPMEEVFRILNEQTRMPAEHPVARVIREGVIVGLANHTVLIAREGAETPIEDSAAPIRDDQGAVVGVVMVFRNVAEQRRSELLLTDQRKIFEQMARGAPLGDVLEALCEAVERQSAGCVATVLLADDEGRCLHHAAGRRCPVGYASAIDPVLVGPANGSCGTAVYRGEQVIVADIANDPLWVDYQDLALDYGFRACWSTPIPSSEGNVLGTFALYFPATQRPTPYDQEMVELLARTAGVAIERQRADDRLRHSEDRYRTLIEVSPQVVWYAEADGSLTYCNTWFLELTGLSKAASQGSGWMQAIHPDHRDRVREVWRTAAARSANYEVEIPFRRAADGTYRWHVAKGVPVKDQEGQVISWVGVATDIDDRKRADEERRAAKEEAERANRAKDQFLAVLSHELRTPLNPILLAASSMLDRPTPHEEIHPTLEMIRHNVNLQARLIDDLLDVMRIVQGKMPLHWGVADCHDVIRHALQVCQSEVFGKTIGLTLDLAADRHHVNADSARLQQVFWNLIKNAVKFSPDGGTLCLRTRNEGGEQDRLIVEVSDTGIGVEPDVLPTIFDPFQQGETSITRRFGGLGLGLAICRGVVEAHGGTITAESAGKSRGTTFQITLNALPSREVEEKGTPQGGHPVSELATAPTSTLKILVVEDEEATRRLMARLLRSLGHNVATAGTIAEATEAAEAEVFDLIVSDIGLPDGSGLELMRRIVTHRGPVPAIALTGYGMEEDIVRSREAGFTAHMTKPIDFTKLEAMIRQVAPSGR
ncbi:PAS domain S-box protein [Singulisphaera acidiphila]|uniref:histidine kinase n=1 Tax=Singulisphaera acidiphila (strain ATCC BAA-1392 / DSM 18658 / VKM B-2454 / MOB10) TaxID=886293 RepID=L0DIJ9_SINAD|nr:PAS domain S-box protein [Singulisphaera acidiphila]AGA28643.1 PAS domain S-box [Singulisphaera acidiphila DSM 18658]